MFHCFKGRQGAEVQVLAALAARTMPHSPSSKRRANSIHMIRDHDQDGLEADKRLLYAWLFIVHRTCTQAQTCACHAMTRRYVPLQKHTILISYLDGLSRSSKGARTTNRQQAGNTSSAAHSTRTLSLGCSRLLTTLTPDGCFLIPHQHWPAGNTQGCHQARASTR
jgi:hypothetical protein